MWRGGAKEGGRIVELGGGRMRYGKMRSGRDAVQ